MERLFAGKPPTADSGLDDVGLVVDSVRTAYMSQPDPELEAEHLRGLMNLVHLTDKGDLAVRSASKVNGPGFQVSGLPTRRRRFVLETIFASLAAKIAIGGVAVAMASTGAVAATGNLPDRMQTTVSEALDNVGINIPLGETAASEQEALDKELDADQDAGGAKDAAEPDRNAGFGGNVSEDAQDGGVNGRETGDRARQMGEERRETGQSQPPAGVPMGDADEDATQRSGGGGQIGDTPAVEPAPGDIPAGPDAAVETAPSDPSGAKPDGIPGGRP